MAETQRWLILAHCFNMDGRAASHTITDRLPMMMGKGITPVVISAPTGREDHRFPHYQIFSPAPSGFLFEMRHVIANKTDARPRQRFFKVLVALPLLPFLLLEKLFINLDSHWSWFLSAAIRGRRAVREHHPALVYSTAGPTSTHVAGFLVSRWCGLPWLAEIHDPLIMAGQKRRYQRYRFHRWLEQLIFRHADAVVYFTEKALSSAAERTQTTDKGHVIRPGADPPPIDTVAYAKRDKLHVGYFGSLARHRNLGEFLEAMHRLRETHPSAGEKVVLDVYGADLDPVSRQVLEHNGLHDMVHLHGRLERDPETGKSGRERVFEEMHRCDLLLLIHGDSMGGDEYIPSKLYEYMLTNRPVFGIVLEGSELDTMLTACGHLSLRKGDSRAIATALKKLFEQWRETGLPDLEQRQAYTIEKAVEQLVHIAANIVKSPAHEI
ncbi:glycosyltransferase [Desulfosarcina alkanivorans]|nr:glycosyltransferase [Desulfosarcina alkanivorans]